MSDTAFAQLEKFPPYCSILPFVMSFVILSVTEQVLSAFFFRRLHFFRDAQRTRKKEGLAVVMKGLVFIMTCISAQPAL